MGRVDLSQEPVSLSVTEDPATGRVSFSDVPEQILPAIEARFGKRVLEALLERGPVEERFFRDLPQRPPAPPAYVALLESGELERRVAGLEAHAGAERATYFMAAINRSDEVVLGRTGVLYFVCKKGCHFCQYRGFADFELDARGIADRMLALQEAGAQTLQWLSPTAFTRVLVKALLLAAKDGFRLPLVHKSEGEDPLPELQLLDGLVDVYLPDVKFIRPQSAARIGLPASYVPRMKACIAEMYRQVGALTRRAGEPVLPQRGLMIRHLLMPGGAEECLEIFGHLKALDPEIPIHVMTGYQPLHDAQGRPDIDRRVSGSEIAAVVQGAHAMEMPRVLVA